MINNENAEQIYRLIESLYTHVTDLFTEQSSMMQKMNSEIQADMADMKTELRTEMSDMKTELRTEMADMKTELKEAISDNGRAIRRLEKAVRKNNETLLRHDLDIQMLKKAIVETG